MISIKKHIYHIIFVEFGWRILILEKYRQYGNTDSSRLKICYRGNGVEGVVGLLSNLRQLRRSRMGAGYHNNPKKCYSHIESRDGPLKMRLSRNVKYFFRPQSSHRNIYNRNMVLVSASSEDQTTGATVRFFLNCFFFHIFFCTYIEIRQKIPEKMFFSASIIYTFYIQ